MYSLFAVQSFKGLKILICAVLFSERDADGKNVYLAAVDYDMGNKCDSTSFVKRE